MMLEQQLSQSAMYLAFKFSVDTLAQRYMGQRMEMSQLKNINHMILQSISSWSSQKNRSRAMHALVMGCTRQV